MTLLLRITAWLAGIVLALVLLICAYLQVSMQRALDRSGSYSAAAAALPEADGRDGLVQLPLDGQRFRLRVAGFEANPGGPAILMLHGFPVTSAMWLPLMQPLVEAGFRVVAPDQRGYSPGARPEAVSDYRMEALTGDALAIVDALGIPRFHLVGHDWGAVVGWQIARNHPERILSWSALSIPHPLALAAAIEQDADQRRRSRYMTMMQVPWLPEALMARNDFSTLRAFSLDFPAATASEYMAMFAEPGAARAALNWYRAMPEKFSDWPGSATIEVPTLFLWGSKDGIVAPSAVELQAAYLTGRYRERQVEAGHRLVLEQCSDVLSALMAQLGVEATGSSKNC